MRWPDTQLLMLMKRTLSGLLTGARMGMRLTLMRLTGMDLVGSGAALQARMLQAALREGVDIRLDSPVVDLVEEDGRIAGVVVEQGGTRRRFRARDGVLLDTGGFARNEAMRQTYGPQPASTEWTHSNPGDTGEAINFARDKGAAIDLMDQAFWVVTSITPAGVKAFHVPDLGKPHLILVVIGARNAFSSSSTSRRPLPARGSWLPPTSSDRSRPNASGCQCAGLPKVRHTLWITYHVARGPPPRSGTASVPGLRQFLELVDLIPQSDHLGVLLELLRDAGFQFFLDFIGVPLADRPGYLELGQSVEVIKITLNLPVNHRGELLSRHFG